MGQVQRFSSFFDPYADDIRFWDMRQWSLMVSACPKGSLVANDKACWNCCAGYAVMPALRKRKWPRNWGSRNPMSANTNLESDASMCLNSARYVAPQEFRLPISFICLRGKGHETRWPLLEAAQKLLGEC